MTYMTNAARSLMVAFVLLFAFTACDFFGNDTSIEYESSATINYELITSDETSVSGTTNGDPSLMWLLTVEEGKEFCEAVTRTGLVCSPFLLKFSENKTTEERVAKILIRFNDDYTNTFVVRQQGRVIPPKEDVIVSGGTHWGEQPEEVANQNYIYKTYYTTLSDGRTVRNFSVCYDIDKKCSRWVAYPVHRIYTTGKNYTVGSSNNKGRTNAWAFDDAVTQVKESDHYNTSYEILSKYDSSTDAYDTATEPIIQHKYQADIRFKNGFGWNWARGHMLPSASRYNTWQTNAQTCYATNIMPQNYDFNGNSWADLEIATRNKVCNDTLFVVTGTLFEKEQTVTSDDGKKIAAPTHCYKLLLRTRSGSTGKYIGNITSAQELMCIGFLYENSVDEKDTSMSSVVVSVAEIEQRSGFSFFRNLNPAIADEVKQQCNFSEWNF